MFYACFKESLWRLISEILITTSNSSSKGMQNLPMRMRKQLEHFTQKQQVLWKYIQSKLQWIRRWLLECVCWKTHDFSVPGPLRICILVHTYYFQNRSLKNLVHISSTFEILNNKLIHFQHHSFDDEGHLTLSHFKAKCNEDLHKNKQHDPYLTLRNRKKYIKMAPASRPCLSKTLLS